MEADLQPPSTGSRHRHELCPAEPQAARSAVSLRLGALLRGARAQPPAARKVRRCSDALTRLTRKPSLSTPSSMSPPARRAAGPPGELSPRRPLLRARCAQEAPPTPRGRRLPGPRPGPTPPGRPGRKSGQVGISDVPPPPRRRPGESAGYRVCQLLESRPDVASWSLPRPAQSLWAGRPIQVPPIPSAFCAALLLRFLPIFLLPQPEPGAWLAGT